MTTAKLLIESNAIELGMARKLLLCVPSEAPDWAPHRKSMPLGKLAMHLATMPYMAPACLDQAEFDIATYTMPDMTLHSPQQLLATFDASAAAATASLAAATEAQLAATYKLRVGERVLVECPRALFLQHNYLGHLIHHRAQLGVYLRLLDIPIPGMFGPSADEK